MKKIFLLLTATIVTSCITAQRLDTVYVRNLSLKYESWSWLKGQWTPSDSLQKKQYKKIRTAILAVSNPTNNQQIVIDSIHGEVAILFYNIFETAPRGQTALLGNEIETKIEAYTPLSTFASRVRDFYQTLFINNRKNGKEDFEN